MKKIELTTDEDSLYQIIKKFSPKNKYNDNQQIFQASEQLMNMLLKRQAIPKNRLEYFINPNYQTGITKKSRKAVFEENGRKGNEIFRHPHFIEYLEYFIEGASIPDVIKSKAFKIFEENYYKDDAVIELFSFFKSQKLIPSKSSDRRNFAEELFKLALDLGCNLQDAQNMRNKVIKSR